LNDFWQFFHSFQAGAIWMAPSTGHLCAKVLNIGVNLLKTGMPGIFKQEVELNIS